MRCPFVRPSAVTLLAVLLGCGGIARGQTATDTWTGTTALWGTANAWAGGVAPPNGGSASRVLSFPAGNYSATNNLGSPFLLNGLRFDGGGSTSSTVTINALSGMSLQLAGANPFILQNCGVNVSVINDLSLTAGTAIGGSGFGPLTLSGSISGAVSAGTDALTIDGTGVFFPVAGVPGGSSVTLWGANSFTGNVRLGTGNLILGTNSALGAATNPLVINAANNSLQFTSASPTVPNPITANGTLTFAGSYSGTLAGVISGPGGLTVDGTGVLTSTAANGFTGTTTIGVPGGGPGGLTLFGAGALTATNSVVLAAGSTLSLVNTAAANSTDRVPDVVPLSFQNGRLAFVAAPAAGVASGETFGATTVQGSGTITVTAASQSGTSSVLQFGPLSRIDDGTLFFQLSGGPLNPSAVAQPARAARTSLFPVVCLRSPTRPACPAA